MAAFACSGEKPVWCAKNCNRLIDGPCAACQLGIDDGSGAAHAFPLRREVARIEIVAEKAELYEEFLAIKRPAL